MYWLGLRPGDVHLAISSPGWGKHAWSCFFAPWIAEATVFVHNTARFDPAALLAQLDRGRGDHVLRAADRLADADPVRPRRAAAARSARSCRRASRSTPRSSRGCSAPGASTIRDGYGQTETTAIIANPPGADRDAGLDGPARCPASTVRCSTRVTGEPADEGEICLDLPSGPST